MNNDFKTYVYCSYNLTQNSKWWWNWIPQWRKPDEPNTKSVISTSFPPRNRYITITSQKMVMEAPNFLARDPPKPKEFKRGIELYEWLLQNLEKQGTKALPKTTSSYFIKSLIIWFTPSFIFIADVRAQMVDLTHNPKTQVVCSQDPDVVVLVFIDQFFTY